MSSDVNIEEEMEKAAQEVVNINGPFIPGIERTDIENINDFGDFEYYAWDRYYNKNKNRKTIEKFISSVSNLEHFVEQSDSIDCDADDITSREAKKFKRWLTNQVENYTAKRYINQLDNMCQFYLADGYYPGNPFDGLADTIETTTNKSSSFQSNERITVDDSRLREAVRSTHGSQKIVVLAILLKTGIRVSEACNLDWEDINLNHEMADELLPDSRYELSEYPDSIYIDSDKDEETYKSDTRGNKRKVDTRIPIDSELKRLLLWHALTRERRFDGENPVLMVNNKPNGKPSDRLGAVNAWMKVTDLAKEYDWWEAGRSELENVTPHWFRAKFSSHMSIQLEAAAESPENDFDAKPIDIVKGLRGDKGEDVIEGYRFREEDFFEYIRPRQFKIGLEGV